MTTAIVFPGQGSQAPGMGRELAEAHAEAAAVFDAVDDALGERLSETIWNGSPDDVTLTRNAQPGLMAASLAAFRFLTTRLGGLPETVRYLAGHSLGEYSALAAAGSFTIADTAQLLRLRGDAMQRAVPAGKGAMAAIIGLDADAVAAIASEAGGDETCDIANDNGGGQIVLSGHTAAIERAIAAAKEAGAKRAVPLAVSGPFHSSLMQPAADEMERALAEIGIEPPSVDVVANVTAAPERDPASIRRNLVVQITGTVRWRESVEWLAAQGVTRVVELGSGKVLSGLVRRIVPEIAVLNAGTPCEVERVAEEISE